MKIYHTETQEDYDALMAELEEQGVRWFSDDKPTAKNYWPEYKNKTILEVSGGELGYHTCEYPNGVNTETPIIKYTAKQEGHSMTPEQEKIWTDITTNSSAMAHGFDLLPSMYLYDNANMNGGTDMVNKPKHYIGVHGLEVETVLENFLPKITDGYVSHRIGSALEYILRHPEKNGRQDLEKAQRNLEQVFKYWEETK